MPSNSGGTIITTRGLQLITKLAAARDQMNFTNVKIGTGSPPEGTDPSALTHLAAYKMDGMIAEYGYDEEEQSAYVVMQLTNTSVEVGFVMTEIGLYAMDPDLGEILYAYVDLSDDPNYIMPAENGRSKTVQIKLHVFVGEVTQIVATINPISQVTRAEFEKALSTLGLRIGQVIIGSDDTVLENNDTLFIVDASELPKKFDAAAYTNLVFGAAAPGDGLWAQVGGETRAAGTGPADGPEVTEGKLSVSGQPAPDADFFAKIND